ncbi:MAG: NAD(+) synthase [Ruminococcaceae bacterium]|nr:NAD(+) synthase [Oscillospiraceae bacterium]
MKDGFIKIAAVSPDITPADCEKNTESIIKNARKAAKNGAKLIVFPQLCLTGYTLGDLFLQKALTDSAAECLTKIAGESENIDAVLIVGVPVAVANGVYNCAAVINKGRICGLSAQTMPEGIFRPAPAAKDAIWAKFGGIMSSAMVTCDHIYACDGLENFTFAVEIGSDAHAPCPPSAKFACEGANIIIHLDTAPEITGSEKKRRELCISRSEQYKCVYVYVNSPSGESSGDAVYSGSRIMAENGEILCESPLYERDGILYGDGDTQACCALRTKSPYFGKLCDNIFFFRTEITPTKLDRRYPADPFYADSEQCNKILDIQAAGLKRRLEHINAQSAVIGISGGLDSTLALIATVRAMDMLNKDRKNVIAVTMPCFGTSQRTKNNAVRLCEELGVTLRTVNIADAVTGHFSDIGHDPKNVNVVFENAQARERTQVLMDIANAENGIVVGTGDLSELALGFATYNGDHMSMYGVNATLPKTLIRTVTRSIADTMGGETGKILHDIVNTPVSPELLPPENGDISQKTEEIVGAYELHDFFIYYMYTYGFTPSKIYRLALNAFEGMYGKEEILTCMKTLYRRFFAQQYKRSCLPDGVQVTPVSFSPRGAWRMPSDAVGKLWLDKINNIK